MVVPFPKRRESLAEPKRPERRIEPPRPALTVREIAHRERMLSHLTQVKAAHGA